MTEDEMVVWCQLDGHEFEQAPGVDDVLGGLVCCSPWGRKESDTTVWRHILKDQKSIFFLILNIFKHI